MALYLNDPEFIEGVWESAPKTNDNRIQYDLAAVKHLWGSGFVDTERISLKEWLKIMSQFKSDDDNYFLDHDQFISLDKYRYSGEVKIPFDPYKLNDGKYDENSIEQLFEHTILPNTILTEDELSEFKTNFKQKFASDDNLIIINKSAKDLLNDLLEVYPSPVRNLEVMMDNFFQSAEDYLESEGIDVKKIIHASQQSMFTQSPTSSVEKKARALKDLMKTKPKQEEKSSKKDKDKGVDLAKIKRSKRGMRG